MDVDEKLNGGPDDEFREQVNSFISRGILAFGTALLANAGHSDDPTASCTVLRLPTAARSVDLATFAHVSYDALSRAVGTGYDLSELDRPDVALGALNATLDGINDQLVARERRPVASMATLRVDHPRIRDFIRAKRDVDFAGWRLNLSVFVTEALFVAAAQGRSFPLVDQHDRRVASVDAAQLIDEIAENAHHCGEPGILFKDRIDTDNPTPQWPYLSTAPCAEVAMAEGEACHFGYVNVAAMAREGRLDTALFMTAVRVVTRILDAAVEMTVQHADDGLFALVGTKRRIGVGLTGFADLLISLRISYDSPEAVALARALAEMADFASKAESVLLAQQRGPFPAFRESRYQDPAWLRRKVKRSSGAVPAEEWEALFEAAGQHGLRHATTTAMPPAETPSAIVGSSTSLEPHLSLLDPTGHFPPAARAELVRQFGLATVLRFESDLGGADQAVAGVAGLPPYLRSAGHISPRAHLAVQGGFQSFLDESLSKTVNLPQSATVADVRDLLWMSYEAELKGLAVFRDNCLTSRPSHG
ncbi:hypothetical protein ACFOW4_12155 [Micromonospora sp. GCM10011542]|uniref:hypothetical protein n=1 Tax=Micromonospora sp. GCM10011542 TaxID=3317337 RepID=UPI00361386E4